MPYHPVTNWTRVIPAIAGYNRLVNYDPASVHPLPSEPREYNPSPSNVDSTPPPANYHSVPNIPSYGGYGPFPVFGQGFTPESGETSLPRGGTVIGMDNGRPVYQPLGTESGGYGGLSLVSLPTSPAKGGGTRINFGTLGFNQL